MIKRSFIAISAIIVLSVVLISCKKDANQAEIDKGIIEEYVLEKGLDGQFTSSGLYYIIHIEGSTVHPTITSEINVSYTCASLSGVLYDEGEYYTNYLSNLIAGWQEGIPLIGEGGEITLIIPSGLAYGPKGSFNIPSNEVLIFDITLNYFTD